MIRRVSDGAPILSPRESDSSVKFLGDSSTVEPSETVNGGKGAKCDLD